MVQQEESPRIPWLILAAALLLGFAAWAPIFVIPPMEHILKEELLLTHAQTSWLFSLPIILVGAVSIPGGILVDRIGIRKAGGIGAILLVVGSLLRGTATDFPTLLAFTCLLGIGTALAYLVLPKLVSVWFPRERAGIATGIYVAGIYVGCSLPVAITLPLIFPVTNTFQGTFYIWSIPLIAIAIFWWIVIREPPRGSAQVEPVSEVNIPFRQVLGNKSLWLVAILFLLNSFFFFTWSAWAPGLMMERGAAPSLAALIASIALWIAIPTVLLVPMISYKLGLRKPFFWIPSIILAFLSWWAIYINVPMGWALMALVGIVHNVRFVTIMALPVELMPKEVVGVATGLAFCIAYVVGGIAPWVGGYILDLTGSLNLSFLVLVGVSVATAGVAFMVPETGPRARRRR